MQVERRLNEVAEALRICFRAVWSRDERTRSFRSPLGRRAKDVMSLNWCGVCVGSGIS